MRKRLYDGEAVERNGIRFVALAIDISEAAAAPAAIVPLDLYSRVSSDFFVHFFENNPLSAISLHTLAHSSARTVAFPTASVPTLRAAASELFTVANRAAGAGQPSVAAALTSACDVLANVPSYASREVIILIAAIRTFDATPTLSDAIARCRAERVRVSIVGLHASVHAFARIADATGGTYVVLAPDAKAFSSTLLALAAPPPALGDLTTPALAPVATPTRAHDEGVCVCHRVVTKTGFVCRVCGLRVCAVPTLCIGCNTFLVPATLLARAAQRLRPLPRFAEIVFTKNPTVGSGASGGSGGAQRVKAEAADRVGAADGDEAMIAADSVAAAGGTFGAATSTCVGNASCYGCGQAILDGVQQELGARCSSCFTYFCSSCDVLIHSLLHSCPACTASAHVERQAAHS